MYKMGRISPAKSSGVRGLRKRAALKPCQGLPEGPGDFVLGRRGLAENDGDRGVVHGEDVGGAAGPGLASPGVAPGGLGDLLERGDDLAKLTAGQVVVLQLVEQTDLPVLRGLGHLVEQVHARETARMGIDQFPGLRGKVPNDSEGLLDIGRALAEHRGEAVGGLPVLQQLDEGIAQFQRREVGPVDVFVELEAANGALRGVDQLDRHLGEPGESGRGKTPFAGDKLVDVVVLEVSDGERVFQAEGLDALGQFADFLVAGGLVSGTDLGRIGADAVQRQEEEGLVGPPPGERPVLGDRRGLGTLGPPHGVLEGGLGLLFSGGGHGGRR